MSGGLRSIADSVRTGARSARDVLRETIAGIEEGNGAINAFTSVTGERAEAKAAAVDAARAAGEDPGPLAGVPFAVKNLYDVAGIPTIAGSRTSRGLQAGLPVARRRLSPRPWCR
jgi:Asp-tRNA(Asn)/Glu-tRNA(Gln) amidotransferase A subunit family amidase